MLSPVRELFWGTFAVGGLWFASCVYVVAQDATALASQRYAAQGQAALAQGHYEDAEKAFEIITPKEKEQRGAQLSLKLQAGLLDVVMKELEERGAVVDERRPDVIRVAPAPLYNSFRDCWEFVRAFGEAVEVAVKAKRGEVKAEGTTELEMTS